MTGRIIVSPTQPPTITDDNVRNVNKWNNVFVQNANGETISLDALLAQVRDEVREASSLQLLRSILTELRAVSHMLASGFSLREPVEDYRNIEPTRDQ